MILSNQFLFESLGFTGPGVAFGARAFLKAEVTRILIEGSIQTSQQLGSVIVIIPAAAEEFHGTGSIVKSIKKQ